MTDSGLRQNKKIRVKRELYLAAMELFRQKGFDETSVEEIAEQAGYSRATFFNHFGSKQGVLRFYGQRLQERVEELLDAIGGFSFPLGNDSADDYRHGPRSRGKQRRSADHLYQKHAGPGISVQPDSGSQAIVRTARRSRTKSAAGRVHSQRYCCRRIGHAHVLSVSRGRYRRCHRSGAQRILAPFGLEFHSGRSAPWN